MHPEVDGPLGEAMRDLAKMELVPVWCKGCQGFVKMNSNFAKFLDGEINSCAKCRNLKLEE